MITALLTDIHGNREALSACLDDARARNVARYIFLGDYVGYGADPGWVVDEVMSCVDRGAVAIAGNHDVAVTSTGERMNATAQEAIEWTRGQLNDRQKEFLRGLPLQAGDDKRLFVHADASEPKAFHYIDDKQAALRSLRATKCAQTFCGHVHVPALYHLRSSDTPGHLMPVANVEIPLLPGRQWLAVLGSVGQPRDHDPAACYAVLDDERDTLTYLRVPYDNGAAARKVREAGLPHILSTRLLRGY
jgi:diadenosine tetraphosphatase ApaH/serine/threonine PP2A family protein phosphatase